MYRHIYIYIYIYTCRLLVSIGNSLKSLRQAILAGIILAGRVGAGKFTRTDVARIRRLRKSPQHLLHFIHVCIYIICVYVYTYIK